MTIQENKITTLLHLMYTLESLGLVKRVDIVHFTATMSRFSRENTKLIDVMLTDSEFTTLTSSLATLIHYGTMADQQLRDIMRIIDHAVFDFEEEYKSTTGEDFWKE